MGYLLLASNSTCVAACPAGTTSYLGLSCEPVVAVLTCARNATASGPSGDLVLIGNSQGHGRASGGTSVACVYKLSIGTTAFASVWGRDFVIGVYASATATSAVTTATATVALSADSDATNTDFAFTVTAANSTSALSGVYFIRDSIGAAAPVAISIVAAPPAPAVTAAGTLNSAAPATG